MPQESAHPSRRMLLAGLGAGAVGAVGAVATASPILNLRFAPSPSGQPASWWDRTFQSLRAAGLADWKSVVGETFNLATPNGSHLLKVVAVTAFPASGSRPRALGRSQAFSVVFESIGGPALPAGDRLYELAHRSFPSLPISMGAPTMLGQKTRLVAVFN